MRKEATGYFSSPVGLIKIKALNDSIVFVNFVDGKDEKEDVNSAIKKAIFQLDEYFKGQRKEFDLNLSFNGTDFQKIVWQELLKIPYGKVISYQELSRRIGRPNAARAVGNAIGKNPIAIIVPCHRIIKTNGDLGGYAGGVEKKRWLLQHERPL